MSNHSLSRRQAVMYGAACAIGVAEGADSARAEAAVSGTFGADFTTGRIVAQPFSPGRVALLPSPFADARDRNADYLLSLNPDRLLHNARLYCGLKPKAPPYGGWERRGVAGHTLGHLESIPIDQNV